MAGNGLPTLGRVKLVDLTPSEGLPSDSYKLSVSTLSQSLAHYSAAIIQLPINDGPLMRSCLESSRLYFHHKPSFPSPDSIHPDDSTNDWCKTSGYRVDPALWQEAYDFRPGLTNTDPADEIAVEIPPAGLVDIFATLGRASRDILDAVGFYLNLRSSPFTDVLDNIPLRNREISSSVLSVFCHGRPSFQGGQQHNLTDPHEAGPLDMFSDDSSQVDRALLTLVKPDRAGLHVRDFHGHWVLVDGDLGPREVVVYPGLALYQATAGYVGPAMYRTDVSSMQGAVHGRCSLAFKLMPKSMTSLSCSEMTAAGHGVEAQFQIPLPVDDFMQRSTDQLLNRNGLATLSFPASQTAGSIKPMGRRKKNNNPRCKPLPPSKRLRLEAQRVLRERVQDIADKKGIKLRFCTLKECESHIHSLDSPCANIRMEIGWPSGVPFVHPHDLPNKAKIGLLETYEPGWSESNEMD